MCFYFNFRSPTGNVLTRPSEEQTLSGAEIVAWDEDHDLCLLRITGVEKEDANSVGRVPASYRPYFAGWNAGEHNPPYTAMHHPQASTARYTRCDSKIPIVDYDVKNKVWTNAHYHIDKWAVGTTAGGSSGSPLLDPEGRIIGGLTGEAPIVIPPLMTIILLSLVVGRAPMRQTQQDYNLGSTLRLQASVIWVDLTPMLPSIRNVCRTISTRSDATLSNVRQSMSLVFPGYAPFTTSRIALVYWGLKLWQLRAELSPPGI